jgi:hypothetical protein
MLKFGGRGAAWAHRNLPAKNTLTAADGNHPLKTAAMSDCVCTPRASVGCEGDGLLVVGVVDPEATVLRTHIRGHVAGREAATDNANCSSGEGGNMTPAIKGMRKGLRK